MKPAAFLPLALRKTDLHLGSVLCAEPHAGVSASFCCPGGMGGTVQRPIPAHRLSRDEPWFGLRGRGEEGCSHSLRLSDSSFAMEENQ